MHFTSTVSAAALICCCIVAFQTIRAATEDGQGKVFDGPNVKKSGKLPRWSFDLGIFKVESFFQEQKLEDRLRLSKSYIKHNVRSDRFPTEDPLFTAKHSRVEELINCDNLTSLVKPSSRARSIDCRPLEAHTLDDTYVSPVSDLSITQYVRRSSFRMKHGGIMAWRTNRNDMLIYPLRRDVVRNHIESYVAANKLGDPKATVASNVNLGYFVQASIGGPESPPTILCTGEVFLSINRSELGFFHRSDDPFPEYADDVDFLIAQAYKNGYLFSLHEFSCRASDSPIGASLDVDFTIVRRLEFPYLFVRHKMVTKPLDIFLKYESSVDQVRDDKGTGEPESYNTTVAIRSSSGVIDFMNFILKQSINNEDIKAGSEIASYVRENSAILVHSIWNEGLFFKTFRLMTIDHSLAKIAQPLMDFMNVTYTSLPFEDTAVLMFNFKKILLEGLSLDGLSTMFGLDEKVEYDLKPEDEQSFREEL